MHGLRARPLIASETDLFTFTGSADDVISWTTARTEGFNNAPDAVTTIFSPTLDEAVEFTGNGNREITLPETGTYVVRIRSLRFTLTGTYNLGLEGL